jgi:hypothetical protein
LIGTSGTEVYLAVAWWKIVGRDGPATNHELNPIALPRDDGENTMARREEKMGLAALACAGFSLLPFSLDPGFC